MSTQNKPLKADKDGKLIKDSIESPTIVETKSINTEQPKKLMKIPTLVNFRVGCVICTRVFTVSKKNKETLKFEDPFICPHIKFIDAEYLD